MIELQRHIEILLLENDCVIVPDFGGFMTHQVPAHYDEEERTFFPPLRTLGFNPQLRMNDSVLVQSYVEAYDLSYPEAVRRIEKEVSELQQTLSDTGSYEMENLGTLNVNLDGNIEFSPSEAGVLSPTLYGLSSYSFKPLADKSDAEPANTLAPAQVNTQSTAFADNEQQAPSPALLEFTKTEEADDDNQAIMVKLSWIRNAVAVAAAVVAFFFMASPVANSDLGTQTMSQLRSTMLFKLMPKDTNAIPEAQPVAKSIQEKAVAEKPLPTVSDAPHVETPATAAAAPQQKPVTTYCIIVASQVKLSNAERYVEQLHQQGYPHAQVYVNNNIVRVICCEFDSEAEAYKQLNTMHQKEEFSEAWIYKKTANV